MAGSTFGTLFTITTWGESHGPALGVVVDGCPAGIPLTSDYIQTFLDRRKPGQSKFTTARKESDSVEILRVSLKDIQPEHRFLLSYATLTSVLMITARSKTVTAPDMLIIPSTRNTECVTIAVADVLPGVKPSDGLPAVQLPAGFLKHSEFILPLTPKLSDLFLFLLMHMITLQLTRTGFICQIRNMLNRQVHISNPVSENRILPVD